MEKFTHIRTHEGSSFPLRIPIPDSSEFLKNIQDRLPIPTDQNFKQNDFSCMRIERDGNGNYQHIWLMYGIDWKYDKPLEKIGVFFNLLPVKTQDVTLERYSRKKNFSDNKETLKFALETGKNGQRRLYLEGIEVNEENVNKKIDIFSQRGQEVFNEIISEIKSLPTSKDA